MKKQLLTLQQLISVMDPELYRHLGISDSELSIKWSLMLPFQRKLMP